MDISDEPSRPTPPSSVSPEQQYTVETQPPPPPSPPPPPAPTQPSNYTPEVTTQPAPTTPPPAPDYTPQPIAHPEQKPASLQAEVSPPSPQPGPMRGEQTWLTDWLDDLLGAQTPATFGTQMTSGESPLKSLAWSPEDLRRDQNYLWMSERMQGKPNIGEFELITSRPPGVFPYKNLANPVGSRGDIMPTDPSEELLFSLYGTPRPEEMVLPGGTGGLSQDPAAQFLGWLLGNQNTGGVG